MAIYRQKAKITAYDFKLTKVDDYGNNLYDYAFTNDDGSVQYYINTEKGTKLMIDSDAFVVINKNGVKDLMERVSFLEKYELHKSFRSDEIVKISVRYIKNGELDKLKIMVEDGLDVDSKTTIKINGKYTPNKSLLHYAIKSGQVEIAKYLIEKGADRNATDLKGRSVVDRAKMYCCEEILDILQ